MFGLMRPNSCCSTKATDQNYLYHRSHYCGTCKAIGHHYDHKSRMMLNYDSVFLSELLSRLNEEVLETWESNLQRVNTCFSMPKEAEVPFSLEYAASASVLLAELKVDDNIKDKKQLGWRLAKGLYSKAFEKAAEQFKTWGVDTQPIYNWIDEQAIREKEGRVFSNLDESLLYYAEATAQITGQIFEEGGLRLKQAASLRELGEQFGRLMYILDAFEDFEKDVFNSEFNPLALHWPKQRSLKESQQEQVRAIIIALQDEICASIDCLALEATSKTLYQERLQSNLALRLYRERVVPRTFKERIVLRWQRAKELANQMTCQPQSWVRQMNYYMIVLAVFVSPQTAEYLPQDGKMEVFKWTAFLTATMAGLGVAGVIRRKNKKERRQEKRKERRFKRFTQKIKNVLFRRQSCWSSCCSGCCEGCCNGCCESCCEEICNSEHPWFWILLIGGLILLVGLVVLILFLAGVI